MMDFDAIQDWAKKPVAAVSAVIAVVAHLFQFGPIDAIAATVWMHSGMLLTATSVASDQLAAALPGVTPAHMQTTSQVFGLVLVLKITDTVYESLKTKLNNDND